MPQGALLAYCAALPGGDGNPSAPLLLQQIVPAECRRSTITEQHNVEHHDIKTQELMLHF